MWFLLLLPCVVGAYVVAWRRKRGALRYSSIRLLQEAMDTRSRIRPHIPALFLLGAVVFSLIAVARPAAIVTAPSYERTIVLLIDISLSMAADDVKPSRLAAAQTAAKTFIANQPHDVRIGIVAFASHAYVVQPPTVDRSTTSTKIDRLQLQHHTAIGSGLVGALMTIFPDDRFAEEYDILGITSHALSGDPLRLDRDPASRVPGEAIKPVTNTSAAIVLLTDGADTGGMPTDMAAKFAAERGVRVYTVGFGNPGAVRTHARQVEETGFDESALKRIARSTRGEYFPAATAHELNHIYRELRSRIVLRKTGMELSALFAAAAALLVMIAGGLSLAWSGPIATE